MRYAIVIERSGNSYGARAVELLTEVGVGYRFLR